MGRESEKWGQKDEKEIFFRHVGSRFGGLAMHTTRRTEALDIQAVLIGNQLTMFEVPPQDPQIHGPTVAGDSIMFVLAWPTCMMEPDPRHSILIAQTKAYARTEPVVVGNH